MALYLGYGPLGSDYLGTEQYGAACTAHPLAGPALKSPHPENASLSIDPPVVIPTSAEAENTLSVPGQTSLDSSPHELSSKDLAKGGVSTWIAILIEEMYSLSWFTSALVHAAIIVLLSLLLFADSGNGPDLWVEAAFETDAVDDIDLDDSSLGAVGGDFSLPSNTNPQLTKSGSDTLLDLPMPSIAPESSSAQSTIPTPFPADSARNLLATRGGGLSGRDAANRQRLALGGGGNANSEAAVELGLEWLAAHQAPDGSWQFDLSKIPGCEGACGNSGFVQSHTGSTGLALLCFLGAGYTQHEGPYQDVVDKGLYYLIEAMVVTTQGGDLRGMTLLDQLGEGSPVVHKSGDMYSHGIATLALCEAYALTRDQNLELHAQLAVDFIVYAQHKAGGWRYEPKDPGDTTVSGWQVTALKSGLLGNLHIPREVWYRAAEFYDSVQDQRGSTYGYQEPQRNRISTTAVGLLCRMMLGWPKDHQPLLRGTAKLADEDPLDHNMYTNYYATQVLHHMGGSGWKRWNRRMRDHLIDTQAKAGHERGSWFFKEAWSDRGGRLYTTALSILTLEVYYRYLPIYGEEIIEFAP